MKNSFYYLPAVLLLALIVSSCSKDEVTSDALFDAQEDVAAIEQELLSVEQMADIEDEVYSGRIISTDPLATPVCATRTWEVVGNSRVLTIDFGSESCLCQDGLYRRGVIKETFTGPRLAEGSTRKTDFIGYFVMDRQFNGSKLMTYTGNHVYTRVTDMNLQIGPSAASWYADQVVEMIAGYDTDIRQDDIFQVTGDGYGTRRNGIGYTSDITEPLLRKMEAGCYRNFVDGVMTFTNDEGVVTILDYDPLGGAPCDRLASVTRNGVTHNITLW